VSSDARERGRKGKKYRAASSRSCASRGQERISAVFDLTHLLLLVVYYSLPCAVRPPFDFSQRALVAWGWVASHESRVATRTVAPRPAGAARGSLRPSR